MNFEELGELLYRALGEPVGLLLRTSDRERLRQRLYQARARIADSELARVQIRISPFPDGDIVLCKGAPKAAKPKQLSPEEVGL